MVAPFLAGGTVQSLLPPINFSHHTPTHRHLRFASRPLRYDSYVGFAFDFEDPIGADENVKELVEADAPNTWICKTVADVDGEIRKFVAGKGKDKVGGKGGARL